jgi:hypothetical protein
LFTRDPMGYGAASVQRMGDLEDRLLLLNRRLASKGYKWVKSDPIGTLPDDLRALRVQMDALELMKAGGRMLPVYAEAAKYYRIGGDFAQERNYKTLMVRYAQAMLAANPDEMAKIETAIEMLDRIPMASPAVRQADALSR